MQLQYGSRVTCSDSLHFTVSEYFMSLCITKEYCYYNNTYPIVHQYTIGL